jgi:Haem-binding domain
MQQGKNTSFTKRKILIGLFSLAVLGYIVLEAGQFVVFGFPNNPPVTNIVQWDTPRTQELWARACQDCHSNETVWPWYSYLFPAAALVIHDVDEGRDELNVSTNNLRKMDDAREVIEDDEMPPAIYLPLHPEAKLTDAEKEELIAGLSATFR